MKKTNLNAVSDDLMNAMNVAFLQFSIIF